MTNIHIFFPHFPLKDPENLALMEAVNAHTSSAHTQRLTQKIQRRIKVSNHRQTTPLQRSRQRHHPNHRKPSLSMI